MANAAPIMMIAPVPPALGRGRLSIGSPRYRVDFSAFFTVFAWSSTPWRRSTVLIASSGTAGASQLGATGGICGEKVD